MENQDIPYDMINKAVLEMDNCTKYLENYVDAMENLPNSLGKDINQINQLNMDSKELSTLIISTPQAGKLLPFRFNLFPLNINSILEIEINMYDVDSIEKIMNEISETNKDNFKNNDNEIEGTHDVDMINDSPKTKDEKLEMILDRLNNCLLKTHEIGDRKLNVLFSMIDKVQDSQNKLDQSQVRPAYKFANNTCNVKQLMESCLISQERIAINNQHLNNNEGEEEIIFKTEENKRKSKSDGGIHQMIECDNSKCIYRWFHFPCVNLLIAPEGKWYCDDCINNPNVYIDVAEEIPQKHRIY
ncbi:hypothetical protein A3Q56_02820 [Intoshia linei]|uniref:Zinc finger PHD-type domain-containing protein n=1 Tax=Intoshia linei TaxID=1819745 RepID=A0A177B5A5_9BILA|nr:hypothetical protein A3Q56_02820 [Intoshia linei]